MQNVKEMNCSDEAHCQVIVTITCHHVMFCNASVDVEGVNARGNNVFWKIADDETSQKFAFDPRRGIEFKTEAGRKAFDCMEPCSVSRQRRTVSANDCDRACQPGKPSAP